MIEVKYPLIYRDGIEINFDNIEFIEENSCHVSIFDELILSIVNHFDDPLSEDEISQLREGLTAELNNVTSAEEYYCPAPRGMFSANLIDERL